MWPKTPARVTAPQAAVEELGVEGAPKPGCSSGQLLMDSSVLLSPRGPPFSPLLKEEQEKRGAAEPRQPGASAGEAAEPRHVAHQRKMKK